MSNSVEYSTLDAVGVFLAKLKQLRHTFDELIKPTDPETPLPELRESFRERVVDGVTVAVDLDPATKWIRVTVNNEVIMVSESDVETAERLYKRMKNHIQLTPRNIAFLIDWIDEYVGYIAGLREERLKHAEEIKRERTH